MSVKSPTVMHLLTFVAGPQRLHRVDIAVGVPLTGAEGSLPLGANPNPRLDRGHCSSNGMEKSRFRSSYPSSGRSRALPCGASSASPPSLALFYVRYACLLCWFKLLKSYPKVQDGTWMTPRAHILVSLRLHTVPGLGRMLDRTAWLHLVAPLRSLRIRPRDRSLDSALERVRDKSVTWRLVPGFYGRVT